MPWRSTTSLLRLRKDMTGARSAFEKFLETYPARDRYRADAYNRLGDIRYSDREFEAAVGDYDRAVALNTPERYYAQWQRAVTLGILGAQCIKLQALRQIVYCRAGRRGADAACTSSAVPISR